MLFRLSVGLILLLSLGTRCFASISVFINEFHYDDIGTDVSEFIEIAGPAGTSLNGWRLVLYDGASGTFYSDLAFSAPTIIPDSMMSGYGTVTRTYAVNGIKNDSPGGIALVDNTSSVIQFLSYEGSFTAANGPAMGLTSMDIGIEESDITTPDFSSLQLMGTGTVYEDFTWTGGMENTAARINTGQVFAAVPEHASFLVWSFGLGLLLFKQFSRQSLSV